MSILCMQLKEEVELQKQRNIAELNDLDEDTRIEIEGFRTGTYVRLEIQAVPCEMVEYFDPSRPILVGGISLMEENEGYMQVCTHYLYSDLSSLLYYNYIIFGVLTFITSLVLLQSYLSLFFCCVS